MLITFIYLLLIDFLTVTLKYFAVILSTSDIIVFSLFWHSASVQ